MSFEPVDVYLPNPDITRGKSFPVSTDPTGKYMLYPFGLTLVVREIEDPTKGYTFTGHAKKVTAACYAPSGFYVASGDESGRLLIWDTTQDDHMVKYEYRPLSSRITDIKWSPDSKRIVVCGESGEKFAHAFLWDSGSSVGQLEGHTKICNSIDFKTTRPFRVVTGSDDKEVGFYEGPPFKLSHKSQNHTNFVNATRFAPDGSFFASASSDGTIFLYDGKTGETVGEVKDGDKKAHTGGIYSLAWSPCSSKFVTASADRSLKVWDAASKTLAATHSFGDAVGDQQYAVIWVKDTIVSFSLNGNINYFDAASLDAPSQVIVGHSKPVTVVTSIVDSNVAYSASYDGVLCRFDLESGRAQLVSNTFKSSVISAQARDNAVVASCIGDEFAEWGYDSTTIGDHSATESTPKGVSHANGVTAVATAKAVFIRGSSAPQLDAPYGPMCCDLSSDASELLVGGEDGKVHVYSVNDGALSEKSSFDCQSPVTCVAYSPDGQHIGVGTKGRHVAVYTNPDYTSVQSWRNHTACVNGISWHPSSRAIASGGLDTNVLVFSLDNPRKKVTIKGAHPGHSVVSVCWKSPEVVLSGGQDGSLRTFKITLPQ